MNCSIAVWSFPQSLKRHETVRHAKQTTSDNVPNRETQIETVVESEENIPEGNQQPVRALLSLYFGKTKPCLRKWGLDDLLQRMRKACGYWVLDKT